MNINGSIDVYLSNVNSNYNPTNCGILIISLPVINNYGYTSFI